jgi:hypothetical protein
MLFLTISWWKLKMESENKKEIEDCKSYEQRCEDTKITDKVVTHVEISFYFDKIIFPRGTLIYIFFLIVFLF